jgi:LysR family transcriptional regulator for metE and metH
MPAWAVQPYLDKGYVESRRIRKQGVTASLHAATTASLAAFAYMREFISMMKKVSFATLSGIKES